MKFLGSIVKLPSNRKFNYQPMYYDPVKEELENRKAMIQKEVEWEKKNNLDASHHKARLAYAFKRSKRLERKSSLLQVFIAIFLFFVFFYLIYGESFTNLFF